MLKCLVGVSKTTHTRHNSEYVVVGGVYADLSSRGTLNSSVGKNKLKGGVVDTREIAGARWLVLFWAESERVNVDASVGGSGVALVWLDEVEVGTLTL